MKREKLISIFLSSLLLILVVSLSGCTFLGIELPEPGGGITPITGGTGLSVSLTTDKSEVKAGSPATFIATINNLADENATNIAVTLNATGWSIENPTQQLSVLRAKESYKPSWVLYAPVETGSYSPNVNVFYKMQTKKNIKVRIYDNAYLNTLSSDKRKTITESSALQSESGSRDTPIILTISLQQPFIMTQNIQEFPFVITIQDVGSGEAYNPSVNYYSLSGKDQVIFSYQGRRMTCDVPTNSVIQLEEGSKGIACKFTVSKSDVNNYLDESGNFTIYYAYVKKASTTIKVV